MVEAIRQMKRMKAEVAKLRRWQQYMIDRMQAGSGATDASGDASVTFPHTFTSVPKVFLQGVDASARGIVLDVVSKSATGFTAKARKATGLPTDYGLINMGYYTGSAYTALPSQTAIELGIHSHTVDSHAHSIGAASTGTFVTGGWDPGHSHAVPSIGSATGGTRVYAPYTDVTAMESHAPGYLAIYTGSSCGYFRDEGHSHILGSIGSSTTGITFYTASAVTGIPSSTGAAAPGTSSVNLAHAHWITGGTTGTFVTSLAVPSPPNPTYWKSFATADGAPVLAVDFDWLAFLP